MLTSFQSARRRAARVRPTVDPLRRTTRSPRARVRDAGRRAGSRRGHRRSRGGSARQFGSSEHLRDRAGALRDACAHDSAFTISRIRCTRVARSAVVKVKRSRSWPARRASLRLWIRRMMRSGFDRQASATNCITIASPEASIFWHAERLGQDPQRGASRSARAPTRAAGRSDRPVLPASSRASSAVSQLASRLYSVSRSCTSAQ